MAIAMKSAARLTGPWLVLAPWLCLCLGAGCLRPAVGPTLINTIPADQAPLAGTFPPSAAEQSQSGTGKFVIFTREDLGKPGEWDFIAGAWECIPSRPEVPVTKRVEFCHSSWNAEPLLDCLTRDHSAGRYPRFVKLQVDAGDRDSAVNLYDINYRTWEVRCLWRGARLNAFGVLNGEVLCENNGAWLSLNSSTGVMRDGAPFVPLEVDGRFWLVQKHGETSGSWSYDPSWGAYVGHFNEVDGSRAGYTIARLSPDGRSRAWVLAPRPEHWQGGRIHATLRLQRDGQNDDCRVAVEMPARAGSGMPVIPIGTSLAFTRDGKVEFIAPVAEKGTNDRVWTIDIATGNTTENSRPRRAQTEPGSGLFDGVPAPDYLRPYLKDFAHFGRTGLAPAFLMHSGVLKQRPEYPDCTAGVSPDGRHILYRAKEGPLAGLFVYGDLQTKQTVRWKSPPGMKPGDFMEFVWVETP